MRLRRLMPCLVLPFALGACKATLESETLDDTQVAADPETAWPQMLMSRPAART